MSYHKRNEKIQGYPARQHPLYSTWAAMKDRCYNQKNKAYLNYGGRGIETSLEWKDSFKSFALDMGLKPDTSLTLERSDNDKGYCKENCHWATRSENNQNKRVYRTSKTGVSGIRITESGTFQVKTLNSRKVLGCFKTLDEAMHAQDHEIIQTAPRVNNTTGVKGVTKDKNGKYIVRKTLNGVRTYLGYRDTLPLAKDLYENS